MNHVHRFVVGSGLHDDALHFVERVVDRLRVWLLHVAEHVGGAVVDEAQLSEQFELIDESVGLVFVLADVFERAQRFLNILLQRRVLREDGDRRHRLLVRH